MCILIFGVSFIPFPPSIFLGNQGEPLFSLLGVAMWLFASGLVSASLYILRILLSGGKLYHKLVGPSTSQYVVPYDSFLVLTVYREEKGARMRWLGSLLLLVLLVATIIPYQVSFMTVFLVHFSTCAFPQSKKRRDSTNSPSTSEKYSSSPSLDVHLLLLFTWLLPFTAPILVVWIRTLQTAGYTVPFEGDHNILSMIFWLLLGEACASGRSFVPARNRWMRYITSIILASVPISAILFGSRYPYIVYEMATISAAWLVFTRVQWRSQA